jgi:imidazolonepropionase-like amidohydrolase
LERSGNSIERNFAILTTNAANLLGVEKTRGYLKSGMRADIIAVGDNPLDKIDTLKKVNFVMKNGKVFKQNSLIKID